MQNGFINKYLDKIYQDLGLEDLADAEKQEAILTLSERFNNVVLITLLKNLSEAQKQDILSSIKKSPEGLEQAVEEAALESPGLKEAIEKALELEYGDIVLEVKGKS